ILLRRLALQAAPGEDHVDPRLYQLGGEPGKEIIFPVGAPVFECNVHILDIAQVAQPSAKGFNIGCRVRLGYGYQQPYAPEFTALLRAHGDRHCDRQPTEKSDEMPSLHRIASSARALSRT